MTWNGQHVLVTGGGGFIGSHLVEKLVREGAEVRVLIHYNSANRWGNLELLSPEIRNQIDVQCGDIQDPFFVNEIVKGCETVFHLAALIAIPYSYRAPQTYVSTNITGTLNIMQAAKAHAVRRVVHTSTSEAYGTAQYCPIDEKHPLQGQSPYSASKIGADKIAESFYCSYELPVATLRPFNTFGPRQSARAIIPTIITQALTTKNKKIRLGSLTPVRDLLYVKDTVAGFMQLAQCDEAIGKVTNVGNGKGITMGELARLILDQIDPEIQIETDQQRIRPEKSEVMQLICCAEKAKERMGWTPQYSLKEGLIETIEYMKQHLNQYKTDQYTI